MRLFYMFHSGLLKKICIGLCTYVKYKELATLELNGMENATRVLVIAEFRLHLAAFV